MDAYRLAEQASVENAIIYARRRIARYMGAPTSYYFHPPDHHEISCAGFTIIVPIRMCTAKVIFKQWVREYERSISA
ncbi:hypothetical protein [Primorskyibacter sp. S87]|uniref:hypothetical protein n=1 Tax=Primorskyibacter sp. S87 TaxID=3415126 RepID=UPI003C7E09F9